MGKKQSQPQPPSDLTGEALNEWKRVCNELTTLDRLNSADRALLILYCRTFATWQAAAREVSEHGAVIDHPNKVRGMSHDYKVMKETSKTLTTLLVELGLTPKSRNFDEKEDEELPPLQY